MLDNAKMTKHEREYISICMFTNENLAFISVSANGKFHPKEKIQNIGMGGRFGSFQSS